MADDALDTDEVAAIYDELLQTYKKQWDHQGHRSLHLGYYDDDHTEPGSAAMNTMRILSNAAGITESDTVLNIGCGAGEDSVWNARAHGATVIGVNISEQQLELARENARNHDVAELTDFRYDDFHELSTVEDDAVDVVWGLEALSHSHDRAVALEQARRVLEAGGRVAFTDIFLRPGAGSLSEDDKRQLAQINDALGIRIGPISAFDETLESTGFTEVSIRNMTDGIRKSTKRRQQFSKVAGPVGKVLDTLGTVSSTQVDAFDAHSSIHDFVERGVIGYYLATATLSA
ncbi:Methyltransferase domain-containing protein [Halovenus aranensis]|uniref:Methyltransferase domain-containing protein n=1 Tax=Halovenus aranensis TaxID=890420 RepID=A0A1G8U7X9_9EURY|nr:methyltransferase domain-containing protein [Halovenus aranensis]SDJ49819.1 Methyltransferase domain-containing protein [Halovenus aranensis]